MAELQRPRPLWGTVLLDAVLLLVLVLDVRAALFWSRVGGSLGTPIALAATGVAVLAAGLLALDLRRQLLLRRARQLDGGTRTRPE